MIYREFYSELGKLLYAVADIDGMISKAEKKKLQEIVEKELAPMEKRKDKFGTNVSSYSETEFEILDEEIGDAEAAFESFINFTEEHRTAFDAKLKMVCLRVAKELAAAYQGTNKKEKELIGRLKKTLDSL